MFTLANVGLGDYNVNLKLCWTRNLRSTRVKETANQDLANLLNLDSSVYSSHVKHVIMTRVKYLGERFWWNSYVDSEIVRFLRKMDGPSRHLDRANFSPKKKGKQCAALVVQILLWPQWFAYELSLLQVYAQRHVFLLSFYRSILILFSVNYRWG